MDVEIGFTRNEVLNDRIALPATVPPPKLVMKRGVGPCSEQIERGVIGPRRHADRKPGKVPGPTATG